MNMIKQAKRANISGKFIGSFGKNSTEGKEKEAKAKILESWGEEVLAKG